MIKIVFLFQFIFIYGFLYSQNQANMWYFNEHCGLNFNDGTPTVLHDGETYSGSGNATISDSLGNLLFYTDWEKVFNKNHEIMQNGTELNHPGVAGRTILKWPGKENLYYIFTAVNPNGNTGFYYSLVDLALNNGLGAIIEKENPVQLGWDAADRIAIVKVDDSDNAWVIARKFFDDSFACFLVNENGLNSEPIISILPNQDANLARWGYIKISYNKKYLISSYQSEQLIEICNFNSTSGEIDYLYSFETDYTIWGIEFSPDSKYLYVGYSSENPMIYQYEIEYIDDPELFRQSGVLIGYGAATGMQLARDGKIYCCYYKAPPPYHYVSVIHNPWLKGTDCLFEPDVIDLYPGTGGHSLPNILLDHLYRFEWTDEPCKGYPIRFKPNFIPIPDSIVWNFDELAPGSTSTELFPTYTFKYPGVHEVQVDVWYPSGRYEHTSREIEIFPTPDPDLGPDSLICNGASITLNANCDADFFSWSTGQFGVSSITVSDSGTYWLKGWYNDSGCEGYDTIHIGFHPLTLINEDNLIINPTICNGSNGSITGLQASGFTPFAFQWLDLSGNDYGTNIGATGLPAGQYQLTITDGNGCETVSDVYTIEDAGDLQVTQVQTARPHCFRNDGQIMISAYSPSGSTLEYSIDNGNSYSTDSVFSGLFAGDYVIRIQDINGCEGFYLDNPLKLEDIPGPQVTQVNVTDETDFLENGAIEIVASGSTPTIYYSIDSGATWQINDGNFENLVHNTFYIKIKDENNCDTAFTVEIQNIILTWLHTVTGEGGHCLGNTAMVPVNVDNFNAVADFHLKLGYNADNLECEGFANVQPLLIDSLSGWVDQVAGDVHLAWNSPTSVSFPGTEKVADLVFTTKNPGQGQLSWYTVETESYFTNSSGNQIPAQFSTGQVTIYESPEIILDQSKTACTGQSVFIMSIATGNQPPIDYLWIYPNGDTTANDPMYFNVYPTDGGIYTLLATDRVGCTDQKSIELIVSDNPVAAFHGTDTLKMHTGDVLDAGEGMASYRWSPGDTTQSIVIRESGMYSVEMESPIGCIGSDSVYVKLVSEEIPEVEIYVPNAFSPNGDGMNDVFKVIYKGLSIVNCQLSIFDRWGGEVYSAQGIDNGWDGRKNGKDCPGGVYVYKILFSLDGVAGNQERVGTVMLVR